MLDVRPRRPPRSGRSAAGFVAFSLVAGLLAGCGGTGTAHLPPRCPKGSGLVARLRDRASVDPAGSTVSMTGPSGACERLRVYTVQFLLEKAEHTWQQPTYVDTVQADGVLSAELPVAVAPCTAAAVIAVPDGIDLDTATSSAVSDFETWPTGDNAFVPTSRQVRAAGSFVVATRLKGRPSSCRSAAATTTSQAPAETTPAETTPAETTPTVAADPAGCEYQAIGAALRPTVKVGGSAVTITPSALSCAEGVTIYVADFTLTQDPAGESKAAQAGTLFPGGDALTVSFPSSFAQCRATVVFFETRSADAEQARLSIRQELARWPSSSQAVAPAASYVARYPKTRILLARNISGLGACQGKGTQKVSVPKAAARDCWGEGPGSQPGRPEYVKTSCSGEHVYEVYYVKSVSYGDYLASGSKDDVDAWTEQYAQKTCRAKQSAITLTGNYGSGSLATTYIWPSPLDPIDAAVAGGTKNAAVAGGTKNQEVVCLVHRTNLQPVTKRIIR